MTFGAPDKGDKWTESGGFDNTLTTLTMGFQSHQTKGLFSH